MNEPSQPITIRPTTAISSGPRLSLTLGGGGARGLAHLVIIEALEEFGVRPALIRGCSIGAMFGAAYAGGLSAAFMRAHLEEMLGRRFDLVRQLITARSNPVRHVLNLLPVRGALLNAESLLDLVLPSTYPSTFEDLDVPLEIVATDFDAQAPHVFRTGPLTPAVAASIAIPALFSPVRIDGVYYLDGGLVDALPFDRSDSAYDIAIAIDVIGKGRERDANAPPSAIEALVGASHILQAAVVRNKLKWSTPDLYLDAACSRYSALSFHRFSEIIEAAAPVKDEFKRRLEPLLEQAQAGR
ncbi:MAG: patatin-like phospholipase family protein [Pseudomonadota bacterium]